MNLGLLPSIDHNHNLETGKIRQDSSTVHIKHNSETRGTLSPQWWCLSDNTDEALTSLCPEVHSIAAAEFRMSKGLALFWKEHIQGCLKHQTLSKWLLYRGQTMMSAQTHHLVPPKSAPPVLAQEDSLVFGFLTSAWLPSAWAEFLEKATDKAANRSFSFVWSRQFACATG